jgi:arylsulfate sulfotransferase
MKIGLKLLLWGIILSGCNRMAVIKPEVTFVNGNALLPQIQFGSPEVGEFIIYYWPVSNPQNKQESYVSYGTTHEITLINLKAETSYNYYISDKKSGDKSELFSFDTKPLPKEVTSTEKITIDTTLFDGFILVRGLFPKGADVIVDHEGDVVWYHQYDSVTRRPFSWTHNNTVLSIYDSAYIVEYDLKGNQLLDLNLEEKNLSHKVHHDVIYNPNGDIVTLTHDSTQMDLRKFGGKKNQFLRADGILVLDTSGKIKWQWNLLQVLDPLTLDPKTVDITHSLGHANSIAIDRDGHYLVSFRDFSQIWKINSSDGSVIWKLGAGGDFKMDTDAFFIRQHSAYVNETGDLMLFDNGDRKNRPYSRILSFTIDESNMVAATKVNIKLNDELSADKMCSAEQISDDQFMVCTSKRSGIISVVDGGGKVLWRVNLTKPSYKAYYLKNPFQNFGGS